MDDYTEEQIMREVREKGVEIDKIEDLMYMDKRYKDLIPIVLKYIQNIDEETDKVFFVRCLCVKGYNEAALLLIQEFRKAKNEMYKWTIGNTLGTIRDKATLPDLLEIAKDKSHGVARQMIVMSLGFYKTDEVKKVLIDLLNDDDVIGHALYAIGTAKDPELIKYIEPFLNHKKTYYRNEAKNAMKKLLREKEKIEMIK